MLHNNLKFPEFEVVTVCVCKKSARLFDIFDQLCDGQRTPMFRKKKKLALLGLAVQVEYLSNL